MTTARPTAIVGFGRMGRGYAADPIMARHYPYAAHAQVLAEHPAFDWRAVIDPDPAALAEARDDWGVPLTGRDIAQIGDAARGIEVAVLATAPDARIGVLDAFPNLRAVLVEKPLGVTLATAQTFLDACAQRGIMVAVNLWRRADEVLRRLAAGELTERIGALQGGVALYGNGLRNNGTHMIDMVRMLCGEVTGGSLLGTGTGDLESPIPGDRNPRFALDVANGAAVAFQPIRFADYRENGLILWGDRGRFEVMNEGLTLAFYPREDNRAMQGEWEIAFDAPQTIKSGAGTALYAMYDNLMDALDAQNPALIASPGASALTTARIVEAIAGLTPATRRFEVAGFAG